MPIPDFVLALRSKIGHDPLPLPGVIAVVLDERGRVLLVRRSDTHDWALTTGCLDPGEQPAAGAVREVREETGVEVVAERLLAVEVGWFDPAEVPPLPPHQARCLATALDPGAAPWFAPSPAR
ncbi:hypothetical protein Ade02nite_89160 [Paractinoplanes deccanensis]|uniref:Nudix hydrolase domain-containing protein n=1 Tax=Paractinoplanes deccanensis TaxID=113561 RepID=A0ABQ3YK20_9ACTN|nr:NUDIX domain-containing protein [Actinoplanes deccanensis]GID80275.1 hypothetical protein Ade02nite_89160 [Actinoplanes deccanensis]